jgi:polysaccharide chain length determinant protein (PEP-CTERM system associated)
MQELLEQARDVLREMWRWRWVGVAVAWGVAIVGFVVISRMTDRYEASARVSVDTESVLKPLLSGLAIEPNVDQMVAILARTLLSRPTLEKVATKPEIGFSPQSPAEIDAQISRLARDVRLNRSFRDSVFEVTYRDVDPERARRVVDALVELFTASGQAGTRRDTVEAIRFLDEQVASYEKRLAEAEGRLKDFRLKNFGLTWGGGDRDAFARMGAVQEELTKVRIELRAAERSRDSLRMELTEEQPSLLPDPALLPAATALPEVDARIETLVKQLDELTRRYTDAHPDVVSTRRQISQLEEQKRVEIEKRKRAAAAASRGRPSAATNPVFQQLRISLAASEANVASLQARVRELQGQFDQMRSTAARYPQLEAELAQLNRDYDVIKRSYEELVARRESASISQEVDTKSTLTDIQVVDPPHVNPQPVFPGRTLVAALAFLVAIGAGLAIAFVLSQFFPTIQYAKVLRNVAQRPVLGSVTFHAMPSDVRRIRMMNLGFGAAGVALVFAFGTWLALLAAGSVIQGP